MIELFYTEIIVDNRNDMNNNIDKKIQCTACSNNYHTLNSDGTQYKQVNHLSLKEQLETYIEGLK